MPVCALGTYLPPWEDRRLRVAGPDEDAVTMAVAAGLAVVPEGPAASVQKVVLISRDLPLLEGGNGPALLAGLGLGTDTRMVEQLGGAPAVLDALSDAEPGTLVIGVDAGEPSGAGAALVGATGVRLNARSRVSRSLPVHTRMRDGVEHDYDDPRLLRERGVGVSLKASGIDPKGSLVAGLSARDAAGISGTTGATLPTRGASSPFFALAELLRLGEISLLVAVEDAALSAVEIETGEKIQIRATALPPHALDTRASSPGPEVKISLAAYERAFDSKLRWEAGGCRTCGTLSFPVRFRCLECGSETETDPVPLPRRATVYTITTIHVPVPGLTSPYSLGVVEMNGVGVRALVQITGSPPGSTSIGDVGELVFRRVALRSGIPDYGYAFLPDSVPGESEGEVAQ